MDGVYVIFILVEHHLSFFSYFYILEELYLMVLIFIIQILGFQELFFSSLEVSVFMCLLFSRHWDDISRDSCNRLLPGKNLWTVNQTAAVWFSSLLVACGGWGTTMKVSVSQWLSFSCKVGIWWLLVCSLSGYSLGQPLQSHRSLI